MALPESQGSKPTDQEDKDFDPTPEALIDEIDDERTLEEEEALDGNNRNAVQEELDELKKESEMPIEELLAYYERMRSENSQDELVSEEEGEDEDDDEDEDDQDDEEPKLKKTNDSDIVRPATVDTITAPTCPNQECELNQEEETEGYTQSRHKHSMTDFIIDDETGGVFKTLLSYDLDDSDDMDEDYSCTDDEREWRRVIHIGSEFQAEVPEGLSEYDDLPPYENEDKLVWKCNPDITQERLIEYLKEASALSKRNDVCVSSASIPKISSDSMRLYRERMHDITSIAGSHATEHNHENFILEHHASMDNLQDVYMSQSRKRARIDYELEQENAMDGIHQVAAVLVQHNRPPNTKDENSDSTSQDVRPELSTEDYFQDEEQLLYLLLQCNLNLDEAIRRRKLDSFKFYLYEPMSLWSQEECLGFEHGLRTFGKNFRLIRESKVQTRTHAELVAFYYLWKKSERHDVYTNQYKLDRKRCLSHPGTTDYMDKFIEDNESAIMDASPSSSTPNLTENASVPKLKEYLVRSEDPTQKKLPCLLKTHPILERTLDEAKDTKTVIEAKVVDPIEETREIDTTADHQ